MATRPFFTPTMHPIWRTELYTSSQASSSRDAFGAGNKWVTPQWRTGKYLSELLNSVAVFGLLTGSQAALAPAICRSVFSHRRVECTYVRGGNEYWTVAAKRQQNRDQRSERIGFRSHDTCGSLVPAGLNCTVSITFQPTASGVRVASLSLTDDAGNSPQVVALSGSGSPVTATTAVATWAVASATDQTLTLLADITKPRGIRMGALYDLLY